MELAYCNPWQHVLYPDIRSLIRECLAQEEDWASLASLRMTCRQEEQETEEWFNSGPLNLHWIISYGHFHNFDEALWNVMQLIKKNNRLDRTASKLVSLFKWGGTYLKSVRISWYNPGGNVSFVVRSQQPRSRFLTCVKNKGYKNLMAWGRFEAKYQSVAGETGCLPGPNWFETYMLPFDELWNPIGYRFIREYRRVLAKEALGDFFSILK